MKIHSSGPDLMWTVFEMKKIDIKKKKKKERIA